MPYININMDVQKETRVLLTKKSIEHYLSLNRRNYENSEISMKKVQNYIPENEFDVVELAAKPSTHQVTQSKIVLATNRSFRLLFFLFKLTECTHQ